MPSQTTTTPASSGSLILAESSLSLAVNCLPAPEGFRFCPGRRLTEIIIAKSPPGAASRGRPKGEADRQHQERCDLVHVHVIEHAVRHVEAREGVRQFHG